MKKISKPIVFFGSGPVAAESLHLLADNFTIAAVITKPRAVHHRGDVPVLRVAKELGFQTYTVSNRRELDELVQTTAFGTDLGILIDFGIIVSQKAIDAFPRGIINSHFSLLPEWRGADPITFSILSGQKETGVSLMLLTAGMDEGPILAYAQQPIGPEVTTIELTDQLVQLSNTMLTAMVPAYLDGEAVPTPQDPQKVPTYSRKLTKDDGSIDWHKPAAEIEREIRAFITWPKSHATIDDLPVIITKAHPLDIPGQPGHFVTHNRQLVVFCGQQALVIDRLKPSGKQEMTGQAFLAGYSRYLDKQ